MRAFIALVLLLVAAFLPSPANTAPPVEPLPQNVSALLTLLTDPEVQRWLEDYRKTASVAPPAAPASIRPSPPSHPLADYVSAIRAHIYDLIETLPTIPDQFERAVSVLSAEIGDVSWVGLIGLFAVLAVVGYGTHWLYVRLSSGISLRPAQTSMATGRDQLRALGGRFALEIGHIVMTVAAGIGVFLLIDYWPDVIERIMLAYLLAILSALIARAVLRAILSPPGVGAVDVRLLPLDSVVATYWYRRLVRLVFVFAFGYATVLSLTLLGFSLLACQIVSYGLGLGLLAMAIDVFRKAPQTTPAASGDDTAKPADSGRALGPITVYLIFLWLLWATGAEQVFWLAAISAGLYWMVGLTQRSVVHVAAQLGGETGRDRSIGAGIALLSSGLRFLLIVGGLALLACAWDIDLLDLLASDEPSMEVAQGAATAVIILLVADVIWRVLKTLIDVQIGKVRDEAKDESEDSQRRSRLATLLPILRNFLWATVLAVAVLMSLSAMGVEIAPLIAGAGIVGVAIGFGAQTLVKDIISGVFYLLDDAFRVGEYIQSGSYRGTVESFSLRSVKLRHSRGPIFTVPFGLLGAVQNMSRDWVIEKLTLTISYDSDFEKARKLIKKVGLELAEDSEFKAITIEPLKMQGAEEFGHYGINIKLKLKTKPGQQFPVRRRALMMIKKAFDENGIKLGSPVIQVTSAAGQQQDAMTVANAVSIAGATQQKATSAAPP